MLCIAAVLLVGPSDAKNRNSKVLGVTKKTPKPLCPDPCLATGTVTAFGVSANGKKGLFRVPEEGHIVAWSVDLGKPSTEDTASFNEAFEDRKFGKQAVAKLAILKKTRKKGSFYKLGKQTPPVPLEPQFGRKPIFTLQKPLKVKKGTVAALTLPTWAPLYTDQVPTSGNSYKASRSSNKCSGEREVVLAAKPQMRKGSTREYGCTFSGERILYWAYFVPTREGGGGGGGNGGGGGGGGDNARIADASVIGASGGLAP